MLVVLPFCHRDAILAGLLASQIATLGGCQGHRALVVASTLAGDKAPAIRALLEKAGFDSVEEWVLPVTVEKGWPTSPNFVFREVVEELHRRGNNLPWFFMEPDCTVWPGWLHNISTEYHEVGKPFMGAVVPTRVMRGGVESTDGEHMVGAGIYPPDTKKVLTLLRWAIDEPWDVYCQWEVLPHAHNSVLFQHNWNTQRYRREGELIFCSEMNHLSIAAPVRDGLAVLHGCKDGSLIRLLDGPVPSTIIAGEKVLLGKIDETLRGEAGRVGPAILAQTRRSTPEPKTPKVNKKALVARARPRDAKGRLLPKNQPAAV